MTRFLDPHEGSVLSLALMYLRGGKSPLPALKLTKLKWTQDVIRALAGEAVDDTAAKACADDLRWWHFGSKMCPDCEGAGMVRGDDGYVNCAMCHGMRKVDKDGPPQEA